MFCKLLWKLMGQIQISVFVMQPTWIAHLQGKIASLNSVQRQKGPRAGTETSGSKQTLQRSFVMYTACYGVGCSNGYV